MRIPNHEIIKTIGEADVLCLIQLIGLFNHWSFRRNVQVNILYVV